MPGINSNLYPPLVETFMPAFVRTTRCRVYFSLSSFNSIEDIKNIQVVVINQSSNLSALKGETYPAGIKIANIGFDDSVSNDNKYYVDIEPTDLSGNAFEVNQFYKVQLRFTQVGATDLTDKNKIAPWLIANQAFFSEWSTVCLIKGIEQPRIRLKSFNEENENKEVIFTSPIVDFVGSMYFVENSEIEKEYLKYYSIKIYDRADDSVIYDSGNVYTNSYNPNEINYTLKTLLEDGINYRVEFHYTTINEYSDSLSYNFIIIQNVIPDPLNATIKATADKENGRIKINLVATTLQPFSDHVIIKRSCEDSNFTVWEDVYKETIAGNEPLNLVWYDYTVESGVFYKYCTQRINEQDLGGIVVKTQNPVMVEFDDIFLSNGEIQLKVKYNPTISSFKTNLVESKTDTLGSKYPFIRRNGNVGYRDFPISGLITAFCDEDGLFINKDTIYGDNKLYYINYNNDNNITPYSDYIYERRFREKVMDFLYEDSVKLFRSNTEGNMLIKLMDISFSPEQTLGRMIYTFSASAYEIDECSLDIFHKYNIQTVGQFKDSLSYSFVRLGQIYGTYEANKNLLEILQDKYGKIAIEKRVNTVKSIKWLRIEFNSDPYFIKVNNNNITPLPANESPSVDTPFGYIVYINDTPMIVTKYGRYELIDDDTNVTSVYFPVECDVTIDYIVEIEQQEEKQKTYGKITYYTKVSQEFDVFDPYENMFNRIYFKHYQETSLMEQRFLSLNKLTIEAIPGTVVYIKDSFDDASYEHVIGHTGVLELYDEDTTIEEFYFKGIQLYPAAGAAERPDNFIDKNIVVNDFSDIESPQERNVYTIGNKRYIRYNSAWYEFNEDNQVVCSTQALVDYIFEMMIGEYN